MPLTLPTYQAKNNQALEVHGKNQDQKKQQEEKEAQEEEERKKEQKENQKGNLNNLSF